MRQVQCFVAIWVGIFLAVQIQSAAAQEVSYKGRTITVIVNSAAGGGTDAAARIFGNTMSKYLLGKPQMSYRNMPAGGGLQAHNYFANRVAPDGYTFIAGSRTQISPAKLRNPQVQYDPSKYEFIGGDAYLGAIMMIRKEALPRLSDPKSKPVVFGDIDGTRSGLLFSLWAKEYLGWNLRWVLGYSGTPAMFLAFHSGEIDMIANTWNSHQVEPILKSPNFASVAQLGTTDSKGKVRPQPSLPDVPVFADLILPKLEGRERSIFINLQADFLVNKWFALPQNTPKNHVAAYRQAFDKALTDPDFIKAARNEFGDNFTPLSGERLSEIVTQLVNTPQEDLIFIKNLAKKYGLASLD